MAVTTVSSKSKTSPTSRASKTRSSKKADPSEHEIRILAYSLYERRKEKGLEGDATSDWAEAERQLGKD
jgi:hypothetical protein